MRTVKDFTIHKAEYDDPRNNGHLSRVDIVTYRKREYVLSAGQSDTVHLFVEKNWLYQLVINERYGYAGLSKFDLRQGELQEEDIVFVQNVAEDIDDLEYSGLRKSFWDYAPINQVAILRQWEA
jgi:hypothetical protein